MQVGDRIVVTDNLLHRYVRGTVTQIETCFFRVQDEWNGNVFTFHWNDTIEIEENVEPVNYA